MSETILLWILGTIVLWIAALSGAMLRHIERCKNVHSALAEIKSDLRHVQASVRHLERRSTTTLPKETRR